MNRPERRLRIDMVVPGRFHAFDLARALIARGHDVRLITTYPRFAAARWGLPRAAVRGRAWQGAIQRFYYRWRERLPLPDLEPWLHRSFGRWAAGRLRKDTDAVHVFSGVAEEVMRACPRPGPLRLLVRGSSHIRTQHRLLAEEERRCGMAVEKPSDWMIARELREYGLADRIVVLSSFARDSFIEEGAPADNLALVPLAADVSRFRASSEAHREREQRIAQGQPLRVLMVGSFTPRKGALDFSAAARKIGARMCFRFVGDLPPPGSPLREQAAGAIELVPRVEESSLAQHYAWADVFCLPTVEDGFAVVIAQALASGLPVIASTNSAAPDLLQEGVNGWVVPIRRPQAIVDRLLWCDAQRPALASMVARMGATVPARTWDDAACGLEELIRG